MEVRSLDPRRPQIKCVFSVSVHYITQLCHVWTMVILPILTQICDIKVVICLSHALVLLHLLATACTTSKLQMLELPMCSTELYIYIDT